MQRVRAWLRRRRAQPAAPVQEPDADRASGEDALRSAELFAEEATIPGTPRLKARNL